MLSGGWGEGGGDGGYKDRTCCLILAEWYGVGYYSSIGAVIFSDQYWYKEWRGTFLLWIGSGRLQWTWLMKYDRPGAEAGIISFFIRRLPYLDLVLGRHFVRGLARRDHDYQRRRRKKRTACNHDVVVLTDKPSPSDFTPRLQQ